MEALRLNPVNEKEITNIINLYRGFFAQGNTEMKAAYLASMELGFQDILKSNHQNTQLVRIKDLKYVIFSYKPKSPLVVDFHTDLSVFEKKGE